MSHLTQMLETHPARETAIDGETLQSCIDACGACAETCVACADACLAEEMVSELRRCIRLNLDCADVCQTTARVLIRQTGFEAASVTSVVEACVDACRRCGEECDRHADHHEHCRVCAEACRRCAEACEDILSKVGR